MSLQFLRGLYTHPRAHAHTVLLLHQTVVCFVTILLNKESPVGSVSLHGRWTIVSCRWSDLFHSLLMGIIFVKTLVPYHRRHMFLSHSWDFRFDRHNLEKQLISDWISWPNELPEKENATQQLSTAGERLSAYKSFTQLYRKIPWNPVF